MIIHAKSFFMVDGSSMDDFIFVGIKMVPFELLLNTSFKVVLFPYMVDSSSMPRASPTMDGLSVEIFILVGIKMGPLWDASHLSFQSGLISLNGGWLIYGRFYLCRYQNRPSFKVLITSFFQAIRLPCIVDGSSTPRTSSMVYARKVYNEVKKLGVEIYCIE